MNNSDWKFDNEIDILHDLDSISRKWIALFLNIKIVSKIVFIAYGGS